MKTFGVGAAMCAILWCGPVLADPLSRDTLLELSRVGLGDAAIVAKIEADKVDFDVSTDDMLALKKEGVSSAVIAAAISNRYVAEIKPSLTSPDPQVPHPAGLYAYYGNRMEKMEATVTTQAKTGGIIGFALTGGIASASIKTTIQNETSRIAVERQPRFVFFADEPQQGGASAWSSGLNTAVASPSELVLTRLKQKDGRREARVGSQNIGGIKTGVMDKDRIAFTFSQVRPGVYLIDVSEPLEKGEYGFLYALAGAGAGGAMSARIFDFTVG
ncbi:hypothetical protein [Novosphingobium profundi]|uniref:hypothetical protein n=1 Tax=Novosphingobium profundi TaxID=1774954 RepID=UPI001CFE932F|nr:hypothetical protein [Novosphingobium profundi]